VGVVSAGRFLYCRRGDFSRASKKKCATQLSGDGFGFVSENLSECFSVRYEIFRLTRQSKRGRKISTRAIRRARAIFAVGFA